MSIFTNMGTLYGGLHTSGTTRRIGELIDAYQEAQNWADVYDQVTSGISNPDTLRSVVFIPSHFFALDYITKGKYTQSVGAVSLPLYINDSRMLELIGEMETHAGVVAGTFAAEPFNRILH